MYGFSGRGYPMPGQTEAPISWPQEAFIPRETPYLGQTVVGNLAGATFLPDRRLQ